MRHERTLRRLSSVLQSSVIRMSPLNGRTSDDLSGMLFVWCGVVWAALTVTALIVSQSPHATGWVC